jgi:hypothetical protein
MPRQAVAYTRKLKASVPPEVDGLIDFVHGVFEIAGDEAKIRQDLQDLLHGVITGKLRPDVTFGPYELSGNGTLPARFSASAVTSAAASAVSSVIATPSMFSVSLTVARFSKMRCFKYSSCAWRSSSVISRRLSKPLERASLMSSAPCVSDGPWFDGRSQQRKVP